MTNSEKNLIAYIGSTTMSVKAQKILASEAIPSHVVKVPSSPERRGCGYGVSFHPSYRTNVEMILEKNKIQIKQML